MKEEEIYSHGNNGERERQTKSGLGFTVFYISLLCSCVYIYLEIFLVDVLTTHNRLKKMGFVLGQRNNQETMCLLQGNWKEEISNWTDKREFLQ